MKYLVASDIHGNFEYVLELEKIIEKEKPDKIILLGDIYNQLFHFSSSFDPDKTLEELSKYKDKILAAKGNCDSKLDVINSPFPMSDYIRLDIHGKKFFFTHGHIYEASSILEDVDIFIYGHIHRGLIEKKFNRININAGSLSLPRGGSVNSFLIIDDDTIYLKDLNNNIIDKYRYVGE